MAPLDLVVFRWGSQRNLEWLPVRGKYCNHEVQVCTAEPKQLTESSAAPFAGPLYKGQDT